MLAEECCHLLKGDFHLGTYFAVHRNTDVMAPQAHILERLLGYFVTEAGDSDSLVLLLEYESLEERNERRARLAVAPVWQASRPSAAHITFHEQPNSVFINLSRCVCAPDRTEPEYRPRTFVIYRTGGTMRLGVMHEECVIDLNHA